MFSLNQAIRSKLVRRRSSRADPFLLVARSCSLMQMTFRMLSREMGINVNDAKAYVL